MESLDNFKKYFNEDFWRAFRNKQIFVDLPKTNKEKDVVIAQIYKSIIDKTYYPSTPRLYINRNKGHNVTRIVPVFHLKDYCIYYYCIKILERKIAYNRIPNTFGGWTLGGLIRKSEDDEMIKRKEDFDRNENFLAEVGGISVTEFSFNPQAWSIAYGDLNSKLYASAKEKKFNYVTELDIANYYDSVRLDILEERIREAFNVKYTDIISLLFHFLNYWNRKVNGYNKQTVGIPQDAMGDCSRILANFYLQPYDKFLFDLCEKHHGKYLRYADDQFIFAESEKTLSLLIFKASEKLNCLGLSINQNKVRISQVNELIHSRSFKAFDLLKNRDDKKNKNKVEKFVDHYLKILDAKGLDNIKDKGTPLLNKALFCPALAKIDIAKKTKILGCYLDDGYLENIKSRNFEKIYRLLSKKERLKFINKLDKLSKKLVHNAFHYEVLYFYSRYKIKTEQIKNRIRKLESI